MYRWLLASPRLELECCLVDEHAQAVQDLGSTTPGHLQPRGDSRVVHEIHRDLTRTQQPGVESPRIEPVRFWRKRMGRRARRWPGRRADPLHAGGCGVDDQVT